MADYGTMENSDDAPTRPRRDRGLSYIEVLVAIVLLGIATVGTLAAVRVTVIGSRLERDHSRAQVWLQSAIETLDRTPRVGCDPVSGVPTDPRGDYEAAIQAGAPAIPDWAANPQLRVTSVSFWDGTTYQTLTCSDDAGFLLQLVRIVVTNPDGEIVEDVEVIKDNSVA